MASPHAPRSEPRARVASRLTSSQAPSTVPRRRPPPPPGVGEAPSPALQFLRRHFVQDDDDDDEMDDGASPVRAAGGARDVNDSGIEFRGDDADASDAVRALLAAFGGMAEEGEEEEDPAPFAVASDVGTDPIPLAAGSGERDGPMSAEDMAKIVAFRQKLADLEEKRKALEGMKAEIARLKDMQAAALAEEARIRGQPDVEEEEEGAAAEYDPSTVAIPAEMALLQPGSAQLFEMLAAAQARGALPEDEEVVEEGVENADDPGESYSAEDLLNLHLFIQRKVAADVEGAEGSVAEAVGPGDDDNDDDETGGLLQQLDHFRRLRMEVETLSGAFQRAEAAEAEGNGGGPPLDDLRAMLQILGGLPDPDAFASEAQAQLDGVVAGAVEEAPDDMDAYLETQAYIDRQEAQLQRLMDQQQQLRRERDRLRNLEELERQGGRPARTAEGDEMVSEPAELTEQREMLRDMEMALAELKQGRYALLQEGGENGTRGFDVATASGGGETDPELPEEMEELLEQLRRQQELQSILLAKQEELQALQAMSQAQGGIAGRGLGPIPGSSATLLEGDGDDLGDKWQDSLYGDDKDTAEALQSLIQSLRLTDQFGERGADLPTSAPLEPMLSVNGELLPGQISPRSVSAVSLAAVGGGVSAVSSAVEWPSQQATETGLDGWALQREGTRRGTAPALDDSARGSLIDELHQVQERMAVLRSLLRDVADAGQANEQMSGSRDDDEYYLDLAGSTGKPPLSVHHIAPDFFPTAPAPVPRVVDHRRYQPDGPSRLETVALRGKIDLQNMQLATTFADSLAVPEERQLFFDMFFDAFEEQANAGTAFREAVYELRRYQQRGGGGGVGPRPPSRWAAQQAAPVWAPRSPADAMSLGRGPQPPADLNPAFDLMKSEIYREVAVFISANEERPYFLSQLFHGLQCVKTDDMREAVMDALHHIIERAITANNVSGRPDKKRQRSALPERQVASVPRRDARRARSSQARQAASARVARNAAATRGAAMAQAGASLPYDYAENADEVVSVVTSDAASYAVDDIMFASDPLGDTIIRRGGSRPADAAPSAQQQDFDLDTVINDIDTSFQRKHGRSYRYVVNDLATSSAASETDSAAVDRELVKREFETEVLSNNTVIGELTELLGGMGDGAIFSDGVVAQIVSAVRGAAASWLAPAPASAGDSGQQGDPSAELVRSVRQSLLKYLGTPVRESAPECLGELANLLYDEMVFNKVVREVNRSYEEEIAVLQQTQTDLGREEEHLQSQRQQDLDRLQRERWQRYRRSLGSLVAMSGINDTDSEVDDARDDAMATVCDVPEDAGSAAAAEEDGPAGDVASVGLVELQMRRGDSGASTAVNPSEHSNAANGDLTADIGLDIDAATLGRLEARFQEEQAANAQPSALIASLSAGLAGPDDTTLPPPVQLNGRGAGGAGGAPSDKKTAQV